MRRSNQYYHTCVSWGLDSLNDFRVLAVIAAVKQPAQITLRALLFYRTEKAGTADLREKSCVNIQTRCISALGCSKPMGRIMAIIAHH